MKFIKANIINLGFSGVLAILNMLLTIVEARTLGPEGVGNYQVFVSTQTIVTTVFAFGLGNAGIYFINSKKATGTEYISTILKAEVILCTIVFTSLFFIVLLNESYFGKLPLYILSLYCTGSAMTLVSTALTPVLLARFEVYKYQIVGFSTSVLSFIAIGIIYNSYGKLSVQNMILISAICRITGVCSLFYFLKRDIDLKVKFDWYKFIRFFKYGIQFSFTNVAYILILNIPIYTISFLLPEGFEAVGFYTRATSICTIAIFVSKQVGPMLFAKLSCSTDEDKIAQTRLMAAFFVTFNVIMIIGINLFAGLIIKILYGDAYMPAKNLVRLLSLSILFTGTNELVNNLFSSLGKPRYILYNLIISIIVMLPLIFTTVKLWGLNGAPIAVTVINGLTTILLINTLRKHINISYRDFFLITPARIIQCWNILSQNIFKK